MNPTETAGALAHAQARLASAKRTADDILSREQDLRAALSRALVTDGGDVKGIEKQLAGASDDLNALLAALPALEQDVRRATGAHREAIQRSDMGRLKSLAQTLHRAAQTYEAALSAPRADKSRDAFEQAGRALLDELTVRRIDHLLPTGFHPERLASDIYVARTAEPNEYANPDFLHHVVDYVAPIIAHVENLKPEGATA